MSKYDFTNKACLISKSDEKGGTALFGGCRQDFNNCAKIFKNYNFFAKKNDSAMPKSCDQPNKLHRNRNDSFAERTIVIFIQSAFTINLPLYLYSRKQ